MLAQTCSLPESISDYYIGSASIVSFLSYATKPISRFRLSQNAIPLDDCQVAAAFVHDLLDGLCLALLFTKHIITYLYVSHIQAMTDHLRSSASHVSRNSLPRYSSPHLNINVG